MIHSIFNQEGKKGETKNVSDNHKIMEKPSKHKSTFDMHAYMATKVSRCPKIWREKTPVLNNLKASIGWLEMEY